MIGIAFETLDNAENIGYIIPVSISNTCFVQDQTVIVDLPQVDLTSFKVEYKHVAKRAKRTARS